MYVTMVIKVRSLEFCFHNRHNSGYDYSEQHANGRGFSRGLVSSQNNVARHRISDLFLNET